MNRRLPGVLVLVALLGAAWWAYDSFTEGEAPASVPLTREQEIQRRIDAYLEDEGQAELVGASGGSVTGSIPEASRPAVSEEHEPYTGPTIDGRVIDETGKPVGSARVEVLWWPRRAGDEAHQIDRVTTADAKGVFSCAVPAGDERKVRVIEQDTRSADPFSASEAMLVVSGGSPVTLVVQRAPNLSGVYRTEADAPLKYKQIKVLMGDYVRVTQAQTNWEGRFEARIPPGFEKVHVAAGMIEHDFASSDLLGEIQHDVRVGRTDVVLTQTKAIYITGVLRDAEGAALPPLNVFAKRVDDRRASYRSRWSIVKAPATFRVGPLRPGEYSIVAFPQKTGHAWTGEVRVRAPSPAIELVCKQVDNIKGRVLGVAPKGSTVMWDAGDYPLGRLFGQVKVSAEGQFEIPVRSDTAHTLYLVAADGRAAILEQVMPGDVDVQLRPEPSQSISGSISDRLASGFWWVAASRGGIRIPAAVKEDRTFEIKGLTDGDWHVHLYMVGASRNKKPPGVTVRAGAKGVGLGD